MLVGTDLLRSAANMSFGGGHVERMRLGWRTS